MENFMNKLAEKLSAQDIIRANSQAEAKEAERIRQEAEQYKAQLEELKRATEEYKVVLEELRSDSAAYKEQIEEMRKDTREYMQRLEAISAETRESKEKIAENDVKIHDVGVQIYRNVQAVVDKHQEKTNEEFKELKTKLETMQVALEAGSGAQLPIIIITFLLVIANLVVMVLRILGLI